MNTRPEPQKYLMYVTYFIAGVLGLGGLIGAINDTLDLITLRVSIVGTVIIIVFFMGAQLYLKRFPWHTQAGRVTKLGVGTAVYLFGMITLLWLPQIRVLIPKPLAFPRAQDDEVLIVIATFHHTEGIIDVEAHHEIRRVIQSKINELGLENVRVMVEPTVIRSADRNLVESLGKRYDASILIWGADTGIRIETNFLNLKQPDSFAAQVNISETESAQLANMDAFTTFVVEDMPNHLLFFAMFALSQAYNLQGDLDSAKIAMQEAIMLLPKLESTNEQYDIDKAYFQLGLLEDRTNNESEALEFYSKALTLNPEFLPAYNNRGLIYQNLGDLNAAVQEFSDAISIDPTYVIALVNRASTYSRLGECQLSLLDSNEAIKINPNAVSPYMSRASTYECMGDYEKALQDYATASNIDPSYSYAYLSRAELYRRRFQDFNKAIAEYENLLRIEPNNVDAILGLGRVYRDLEDYEQALANFELAKSLDPEDVNVPMDIGHIYRNLGEYDLALQYYNQAISMAPNDTSPYFNRAVLYEQTGEYQKALDDYAKVISLNPLSDGGVYFNRGQLYQALGEYSNALHDLNLYLEITPNSEHQAYVLERIAEIEEAMEH